MGNNFEEYNYGIEVYDYDYEGYDYENEGYSVIKEREGYNYGSEVLESEYSDETTSFKVKVEVVGAKASITELGIPE